MRIYVVHERIPELRIGDGTCVGYPSSRFPFAGLAGGPFEHTVTVWNNGNVLVANHGERCLHSKQLCCVIGRTKKGGGGGL